MYIQGELAVRIGQTYVQGAAIRFQYMQERLTPEHGRHVILHFADYTTVRLYNTTLGEAAKILSSCNHLPGEEP